MLRIDHGPLFNCRLVILGLGFVDHHVTAPVGETEWNAQELLQSGTHRLPSLRWNVEKHDPAPSGTQQFSALSSRAQSRFIDFVDVGVGDFWSQRPLEPPA